METNFYKGDLIRWIVGHNTYKSDGELLYGDDPIYHHGIIMEVSDVDPACIIVHSRDTHFAPRLVILNSDLDEIEILSSSENQYDK
tara:strand:- start:1770 stop:2027 length:258 start_codon:yes stop_codon:yes gene_type:complete